MPPPTPEDEEERVHRQPMHGAERWAFVQRFAVGLALLLIVYFGLTAFRDYRDNYGVELFASLGYGESPAIFSMTETWVAFGVLAALIPLSWIHNNRMALRAVFGLLLIGCTMIGVATFLLQSDLINGLVWMIVVGIGGYFAYVPFGSVLFDRIVAATRTVGTAVFAIYICDAFGYTGSTVLQLYKDLAQPEASRLEFFLAFCYVMSIGGVVLLALSYRDFASEAKKAEEEHRLTNPLRPSPEPARL